MLAGPEREQVEAVADRLAGVYPQVDDGIRAADGWQFVVRCILVRSTTVALAVQVEAVLAERLLGVDDYAALDPFVLRPLLRRLPLASEKARSLVEAARHLRARYAGRLPVTTDELARVPGLGRLGANRVVADYCGRAAIVADEPVRRVLRRLGWTADATQAAAERVLSHGLPPDRWVDTVHRLRRLATDVCRRGRARCAECPLRMRCERGRRVVEDRH